MADCGAAGSALDRTVSALASATLGASAHGGTNGSQQAVAAAGKAVASLLGTTAATAGGAGGAGAMAVGGGGGLMPAAPPDRLYLPGQPRHPRQPAQQQGQPPRHHAAMDEAWNSASGGAQAHPAPLHAQQAPPPGVMHHPAMMAHPPLQTHPHAAAIMARTQHAEQMHMANMQMNMMMMHQQQQHQQMIMMQQHHQQHQQRQALQAKSQDAEGKETVSTASNISDQAKGQVKNRTRQQTPTLETAAESWHDGLEEDFVSTMRQYRTTEADDVKTVGEDNDDYEEESVLGHEGYVEGASIDQLAAAWAEAEEEAQAEAQKRREDYRAQYGEDFAYDPTDMAAAYSDPATSAAAELDTEEVGMAPYDFNEASAPHPDEDTLRNTNYFDEGMRHFDAGNMSEAIQAFETELRHVDADNSDAWRMLGRCHAENDQDRKAIACLERAVDRDPYSVEALLLLGTSYVNELDHPRALRNLKAWATHNPMYAGMELPSLDGATSAEMAAASSPEERERMALEEAKKLLLKAIEVDPTQAADAMEAVGVVCNVSREYDSAIDYFKKAIDLRPDDYQLWNKLGATLANSNRSDEALPAYHKALELKPKYARAWLNMAISHANLHNYDEAARCYLQTLSLNPGATHVWSYLRIALTCAERWDLLPLAASQNLAGFKEYFDFVQY